jgi:hypothetical protein
MAWRPERPSLSRKISVDCDNNSSKAGVKHSVLHADASTHPKATARILGGIQSDMKQSGYSVTGDFTTSDNPGDTIRCFISDDRTVIAIKYISTYAVGGYTFLLQARERRARRFV